MGRWPLQTFDTFFAQLKRLSDRVEELANRVAAIEKLDRPLLQNLRRRSSDAKYN